MNVRMNRIGWAGIVGVVVVVATAAPAAAFPAGGPLGMSAGMMRAGTAIDRIASRRCGPRDTREACQPQRSPERKSPPTSPRNNADSPYYERDSGRLPFGSSRWWEP